jgi:formylmethanofuran dehydrogenase subunit C
MAGADDIIEACKQARNATANVDHCNMFVLDVAARCGITLHGNADQILGQTSGAGWRRLGNDGVAAGAAAANGDLVVGGMTSEALGGAHGHVVIVVKGPLNRDKYPTAYWGSENPSIRQDGGLGKTINFSFTPDDRDKVLYASHPVPSVNTGA